MAIIIVGKRQPKSKQLVCIKCGTLLEYLESDLIPGDEKQALPFLFLPCPVSKCRHANFMGTGPIK